MNVWIAFLRGVNVGGKNKLPMAQFRAALTKGGFGNVQTYIQSGNAIFTANGERAEITTQIQQILEQQFGIITPVNLRSADALETALDQNPFPAAIENPTTLHLFFLQHAADGVDLEAMKKAATKGEEFLLTDDTLYFYTPNGIGKSDMARKLDRLIGVPMTGRNLRSCHKILDMARGGNA